MAAINPYLMFNGTCEEAFLFYKSVFGGEFPYIGKYKDAPAEEGEKLSEEALNRIMHVSLPIGNTILMGSDSHPRYGDVGFGDNFSISINTESTDEADRIFNGLSAGGKVEMPMNKTFWGAYFGMFKDKFGVNWMVNFDENQPNK
ncbi:VOC family protein [Flavobacterium johnsoniae]|jgi:PhnB protein|uniref:3-demethylubiquinone-9 3-methyltransferase n=1 Tax=Flavobacterium johnsoniae (strain ATCC 17061 / DSM 2064 / JCM 8514 / BCRC 14874 / CCUG 350202 / NBRC 14942 / NCIMB 11054 / UW101) TaxID=376686 RepID=A5FJ79_FLAJ1|nr:VOC family protein [Flavobacterium johnsoniae]ABQ04743.1 3-demethylubiquinone-9 3-methyltransferase [Flavobacterium johnsoniae UW101]OXE96415.1 VOC family protein [Flavobacterium johnsoniae UW101]WQG83459.1 VOC family protein [Flavobacterium johnsoniae UW101]SHK32234.1 PhnB protein [Flavobacterium johnsoniae]